MDTNVVVLKADGTKEYTVMDIPEPEPGPPLPPSLDDRVKTLETETSAISAAIERGLSL